MVKRNLISPLNRIEAKIINGLIKIVPKSMTPDHLTLIAFAAAAFIFIINLYATKAPELYLITPLLYFIHWLGDSLDGTLARYRKIERPRYGHYVDHILDAISITLMIGGLALSGAVNTEVWFIVLVGILLHFINISIKSSVTDEFEIGIRTLNIGPTEGRILGAIFNASLYIIKDWKIHFLREMKLTTFLGIITALILYMSLIQDIIETAGILEEIDLKYRS